LYFKAKKIRFVETEFLLKNLKENSRDEKEPWGTGREIFFRISHNEAQLDKPG
jgi:hypothetical protein